MIPPVANRFVAGETPAGALEHARTLNERGIDAMINRLGTRHDEPTEIERDVEEYRLLIEEIDATALEGSVSVKPSQLGFDLGEDAFRERLERILETAVDRNVFVWLDMEGRATTDATLDAFEELAPSYGDGGRRNAGLGVCIQANLKRSRDDLERLAAVPGAFRLVKGGAYDEPERLAYTDKPRMNEVYRTLLEDAFARVDGEIAVASHDPEMLEYARSLEERHDRSFEVQMLMGVRPDAQRELAEEYDVSQYVPYGERWKRYFLNRVTENRNTLEFAVRAVVSG